jgi:amino acid permease
MFRWDDFQAMIGMSFMVFEGINQALPIIHNCRDEVIPHFPKLLFSGIFTVCIIYISFGAILYINFKAHFLYQLAALKTEVF